MPRIATHGLFVLARVFALSCIESRFYVPLFRSSRVILLRTSMSSSGLRLFSDYSQTILRLHIWLHIWLSKTTWTARQWGVGIPHRWGAVGGWIWFFACFYNPIENITFPPTTSDGGKCKIYSINTFLKITIHSIHSIHHIVENIDIVRVLEVYGSVYRCLKVGGSTLFLRGFPLPHTHAVFPLLAKVGIYTQMFMRFWWTRVR